VTDVVANNRTDKSRTGIITITTKNDGEQLEIEKKLNSLGIQYHVTNYTSGVFCIWCGLPIDIVNDMKIHNDGRIIWLTKHCRKEYAIAFNVTDMDRASDLHEMLSNYKRQGLSIE
jgi:hypothetical protein